MTRGPTPKPLSAPDMGNISPGLVKAACFRGMAGQVETSSGRVLFLSAGNPEALTV